MKRRDFLASTALGLTGSSLAVQATTAEKFSATPFSLGVASGDVTQGSSILWTRLAPAPLSAGGGMPAEAFPVRWALAEDSDMTNVVRSGQVLATPALGHSVHVDVQGLEPGRIYWYQFHASGYASTVGKTKTLPAGGSVRFATASCQNYTHGYFVAYEHMVRDQPDFVIHLGDYIYDTSFGENFRRHETEKAPESLEEFRQRHALYKTDRHLQQAHAQLPFFTTIDNHDAIEDLDTSKAHQRAAAYQAWYEHMPVRGYGSPGDNEFDLCRQIQIGDVAQICLLDARQFRDKRDLCRDSMDPGYGFGNYRERCEPVWAEDRTMLGMAQERWLQKALVNNRANWNVVASPGPFLPFRYHVNGRELAYIGAWDAYPANRKRVAEGLIGNRNGHPLILSGDVHSCWALDGADVASPAERTPVVEFVTSSISANWPEPLSKPVSDNLAANPQVRFYGPDHRGYLLHNVDSQRWDTTARAVRDVYDDQSCAFDLAKFRVVNGKSGLERTG